MSCIFGPAASRINIQEAFVGHLLYARHCAGAGVMWGAGAWLNEYLSMRVLQSG